MQSGGLKFQPPSLKQNNLISSPPRKNTLSCFSTDKKHIFFYLCVLFLFPGETGVCALRGLSLSRLISIFLSLSSFLLLPLLPSLKKPSKSDFSCFNFFPSAHAGGERGRKNITHMLRLPAFLTKRKEKKEKKKKLPPFPAFNAL